MYAFYKKYEYVILALLVSFSYLYVAPFGDRGFRDTDCYIHAWRTYDLMLNKHWAEEILMKSNYPFGEVIHYTRIMDVMWMIVALPLTLFYPLKEAVFHGGFWFQPIIASMTVCAIIWALRPYFNPFLRLFAVLLFFAQPIINQLYVYSRPDHHTIVTFFTFLIMGNLLRFIKTPDIKYMKYIGILSGVMLWTSVEGLLISYALFAAMVILWILEKRYLEQMRTYILYYLISSTICLIINPPYEGFFHADNGRISVLMLAIIGLTFVSLDICVRLEAKGFLKNWFFRGSALGILAAISVGLVILIFGYNTVFGNPFTPEIKAWYRSVSELTPGSASPNIFKTFTLPSTLAVAFVLLIYNPKEKDLLVLTSFPLFFFTSLVYVSIRFAQHSSIFIVFPTVLFIYKMFERFWVKRFPTENLKHINILCFISLIIFSVYLNTTHKDTLKGMVNSIAYNSKDYLPYFSKKEGSVLARVFDGSELIWSTEKSVVATPNHRNASAIVDTYNTFFNNDMNEVKKLLKKRKVTTIMIPVNVMNLDPLNKPRKNDFANRLIKGRGLPCGITLAKDLPLKLQDFYVIYHVDFDNCPP